MKTVNEAVEKNMATIRKKSFSSARGIFSARSWTG